MIPKTIRKLKRIPLLLSKNRPKKKLALNQTRRDSLINLLKLQWFQINKDQSNFLQSLKQKGKYSYSLMLLNQYLIE